MPEGLRVCLLQSLSHVSRVVEVSLVQHAVTNSIRPAQNKAAPAV